MLKIILPVDFSEGTFHACLFALQLCPEESGSQLMLLHCFRDYLADADTDIAPPIDQNPSVAIAEDVIHRNETDAIEQLEELYQQLQANLPQHNIYIERKMVHGSPEDCIPEQVKQYQADLLVMHTDGEAGLGRSIFGTVTTKMVDEVKIPVPSVPKDAAGRKINRVLYATDFDKADTEAIEQLQALLQPVKPAIICVHISDNAQNDDQQKLQQLKQSLQTAQTSNIRFALLPGDDAGDAIAKFVSQERIDLIGLTSRDHSTWGNLFNKNLAKKLILESQTPLLIFHSKG